MKIFLTKNLRTKIKFHKKLRRIKYLTKTMLARFLHENGKICHTLLEKRVLQLFKNPGAVERAHICNPYGFFRVIFKFEKALKVLATLIVTYLVLNNRAQVLMLSS
jgi:hypothetical protein